MSLSLHVENYLKTGNEVSLGYIKKILAETKPEKISDALDAIKKTIDDTLSPIGKRIMMRTCMLAGLAYFLSMALEPNSALLNYALSALGILVGFLQAYYCNLDSFQRNDILLDVMKPYDTTNQPAAEPSHAATREE